MLDTIVKDFISKTRDFVALFFPYYCESCGESLIHAESIFCVKCVSSFPRTDYHLMNYNPIKDKLQGIIDLEYSLSFLKYERKGRARRMLHALKYRNKPEIGYHLAYLYGIELLESSSFDFDIILPIPLHKSKLMLRGYNQSDTIAQGLSDALGIPWSSTAIYRAKANPTQTNKNRLERWRNVDGIFGVLQPDKIKNKHVLLVDDIITSGATIEACGRALYKAGISKLSIACLATGS
jgi:ComF family protein